MSLAVSLSVVVSLSRLSGHSAVRPDPIASNAWLGIEEAKLYRTPPPTSYPGFAETVALDGRTVVAGAQFDLDEKGTQTGSAYVFEQQGSQWVKVARLAGDDAGAGDAAGSSVAVSGTTVVVGAPGHSHLGSLGTGAVHLYERTTSGWVKTQELHPSSPAFGQGFGDVVVMSSDTIAVSAPNAGLFGSVYVFVKTAQGWIEQARLIPPSAFPDALALDENTLVVGIPFYSFDDFAGGRAFVYERSGSTWALAATLSPQSSFMNMEFGHSVAVHGNLVAIGAWATLSSFFNGRVYVYERSGSNWSLLSVHSAPVPQPGDGFGSSVALFGEELLIGHEEANSSRGVVYAFERTGPSIWNQFTQLETSDNSTGDHFGAATAFDGSRVFGGAPTAHPAGGAGFVFRIGWPSFCFGDGSIPTPCPCTPPDVVPSPSGAPRSGCANSFDLDGARLQARGVVEPDVLTFTAKIAEDYGGFALLVKGDGKNDAGIASGDGVRCVDGALVRFGGHNAGANGERPGLWSYPNDVQELPVSVMTAQPAAQTAYYQLLYRNAASGFCSPGTTNWTNAVQVDW